MVPISLVPALALLYFYVSTFRSMCAVPNMVFFCSSFTSWFPGMFLLYFLNDYYYCFCYYDYYYHYHHHHHRDYKTCFVNLDLGGGVGVAAPQQPLPGVGSARVRGSIYCNCAA